MSLTPRTIMLAARVGLVGLATFDGLTSASANASVVSSLALGYCGTLAGLLAFPRVRRGDILMAMVAGLALRAVVPAFLSGKVDVAACSAGICGMALALLPIMAAHVRRLAASNAHMPLTEWRTMERRRSSDRPENQSALLLPQP